MSSNVSTAPPDLGAALRAAAPLADAQTWIRALRMPMAEAEIITPRRIAAFLGQAVAEAGNGFRGIAENLNYTHAEVLCHVFPHEFPDLTVATACVGNPERIASIAYANRLGNGGPDTGDGWRFRGRGLLQLTGRDEYAAFGRFCGRSPEEIADWCGTPDGAAASACWYWTSQALNPLADTWDLAGITVRVNGRAMLGFATRIAAANAALNAMGGQ
jgi:putative chitinase